MSRAPGRRAVLAVRFAGWYAVRFARANVTVAREILTPGSGLAPAVVQIPVADHGRAELASLMSLITLTPGTMALGLSDDGQGLLVHGMHAADPDVLSDELLDLDRRLLAITRPHRTPPSPAPDSPGR
ncbi:Na+/H+ antiporter subunit E [Blastococcus sp. SYSU D01042]